MKITAFNGSPRIKGNTQLALEKLLEEPARSGAKTEIIGLNSLNIKGCQACYACKSNGNRCVLQDDMSDIHEQVLASDVIIFASPIYMWQISAQSKLFLDRLYNFYNFNAPSLLKGKKLILLFTQASQDPSLFSGYFEHFKSSMAFMGFDVLDMLVVPGVRIPGEVERNEAVKQRIKELGMSLAQA